MIEDESGSVFLIVLILAAWDFSGRNQDPSTFSRVIQKYDELQEGYPIVVSDIPQEDIPRDVLIDSVQKDRIVPQIPFLQSLLDELELNFNSVVELIELFEFSNS